MKIHKSCIFLFALVGLMTHPMQGGTVAEANAHIVNKEWDKAADVIATLPAAQAEALIKKLENNAKESITPYAAATNAATLLAIAHTKTTGAAPTAGTVLVLTPAQQAILTVAASRGADAATVDRALRALTGGATLAGSSGSGLPAAAGIGAGAPPPPPPPPAGGPAAGGPAAGGPAAGGPAAGGLLAAIRGAGGVGGLKGAKVPTAKADPLDNPDPIVRWDYLRNTVGNNIKISSYTTDKLPEQFSLGKAPKKATKKATNPTGGTAGAAGALGDPRRRIETLCKKITQLSAGFTGGVGTVADANLINAFNPATTAVIKFPATARRDLAFELRYVQRMLTESPHSVEDKLNALNNALAHPTPPTNQADLERAINDYQDAFTRSMNPLTTSITNNIKADLALAGRQNDKTEFFKRMNDYIKTNATTIVDPVVAAYKKVQEEGKKAQDEIEARKALTSPAKNLIEQLALTMAFVEYSIKNGDTDPAIKPFDPKLLDPLKNKYTVEINDGTTDINTVVTELLGIIEPGLVPGVTTLVKRDQDDKDIDPTTGSVNYASFTRAGSLPLVIQGAISGRFVQSIAIASDYLKEMQLPHFGVQETENTPAQKEGDVLILSRTLTVNVLDPYNTTDVRPIGYAHVGIRREEDFRYGGSTVNKKSNSRGDYDILLFAKKTANPSRDVRLKQDVLTTMSGGNPVSFVPLYIDTTPLFDLDLNMLAPGEIKILLWRLELDAEVAAFDPEKYDLTTLEPLIRAAETALKARGCANPGTNEFALYKIGEIPATEIDSKGRTVDPATKKEKGSPNSPLSESRIYHRLTGSGDPTIK